MKRTILPLMTVLLSCCVIAISYSQKKSTNNQTLSDVFVGSTPCDSLIKSMLKIPSDATCIYIKWELRMSDSPNDSNAFKLFISYGDYQPNTMNFLGGGTKIAIEGKWTTSFGTNENAKKKVYHLKGNKGQSELLFIKMDDNILLFLDKDKDFIVGDASFGYVLNRIQ